MDFSSNSKELKNPYMIVQVIVKHTNIHDGLSKGKNSYCILN